MKKTTKSKIAKPYKLPKGKALALRTCNPDMTSHGGFKWPKSGPVVCPDWSDEAVCGKGLHGLLWGEGDGSLLGESNWPHLAVEIDESAKVDLQGKVKFPSCTVVHCGDANSATDFIREHGGRGRSIVRGTSTSGVRGTSTSGDGGTSTSGDAGTSTSGDGGTSTSGDAGTSTSGDGGTSTSGDGGTSTSGVRGTSTSGVGGTSTSGVRGTSTSGVGGTSTSGVRGTSTSGDGGTSTSGVRGTSTSGVGGTSKTGSAGIVVCRWWDDKAERPRLSVGYVGEDGIKPDTFYRCDDDGKLVESKP